MTITATSNGGNRRRLGSLASCVIRPTPVRSLTVEHASGTRTVLPTKRRDMPAASQWRALVKDKYPAYVSWDNFERIRDMLQDNRSEYQRRCTRGVPRDGKGLLQGIVYCGHCGRKMTIQYKGKPRYNCVQRRITAGDPICQFIWSDTVDPPVLQCFFEALSVAEIDLSARTLLREADLRRNDLLMAQTQQVERLRHAAHLADRQFRRSDPDNRLVTAELERRWEATLRDLQHAEDALNACRQKIQVWAIPADLLEMLKNIGPRLPELWSQPLLSWSQKKGLLRSLVEISRVEAGPRRSRASHCLAGRGRHRNDGYQSRSAASNNSATTVKSRRPS